MKVIHIHLMRLRTQKYPKHINCDNFKNKKKFDGDYLKKQKKKTKEKQI